MTDDLRHLRLQALIEREDYVPAWVLTSEMLNENPDDPKALYFCGCILRGQGHTGMALHMFGKALTIVDRVPNIWMHYGACLHDCNQYEAARAAFDIVREALPDDPMPLANIGATYVQEGKAAEALEWANKALALDNNCRIARIAKAFGSLALGKWSEGWDYCDSLYGEAIRIRVYRDPANEEPLWDGASGKTVVVQADQGLGEMLMFAQILPEMAKDCKKVIVETNPRLLNVFKRNFPMVDVYGTLKEKDGLEWPKQYAIDARTHMSWLGKHYRKTDAEFPRTAYLTPDPLKAKKWRKWLSAFPKPWTGIAWRGGIQRTNEAVRSVSLNQLAPVIQRGGTFISLAYQPHLDREIAQWNIKHAEQIHVPAIDNAGDFDEWVALISELDHTVSVLTTVVHVCGALGKRASVLVPTVCQWQHGYGGRGMLWYSPTSVTNYRQTKEGEWDAVIAEIAGDYEAFVLPLAA